MINATSSKPKLEIPTEVWNHLGENDFINFSVPLLNQPIETNGVLVWSGHELLMVSDSVAAFATREEAACFMPYDEMFRVVASDGEAPRHALIYSVFFEKDGDSWYMMYRLMNADRYAGARALSLPSDVPSSEWMLSMSGVENWLDIDVYANYFCKIRGYDRRNAVINIHRQLMFCEQIEGHPLDSRNARIMHISGDMVVLVPKLTKGWAVMFDIVTGDRFAYFIMDDPPHLVGLFWELSSKVVMTEGDCCRAATLASDAEHFSYAIRSAREQLSFSGKLTAAAFYC